jgi:hypothetical protein
MAQTLSYFGFLVLRMLACWSMLHGFLVCLNSPQRWSGPSFAIVSILPPYVWGVVLILGGLLVLIASLKTPNWRAYLRVKNTGLWIIAAWFFTIAIGFIMAAFGHPDVSLGAGSRDIFIGVLSVIMTKASEPKMIKDHKNVTG